MIYFAVINILTFCLFGYDKQKARKNQWRISESTLVFLAIIGGSIGALAAMLLFHHKTRKGKFAIGIPAILVIQILAAAAYCII